MLNGKPPTNERTPTVQQAGGGVKALAIDTAALLPYSRNTNQHSHTKNGKTSMIEPSLLALYVVLDHLFKLTNRNPKLPPAPPLSEKVLSIHRQAHYALSLCQIFNAVDLQYHFVWGEHGPISTQLSSERDINLEDDLAQLFEAIKSAELAGKLIELNVELVSSMEKALQPIDNLLSFPLPGLQRADQLRLLASMCYLRYTSGYSQEQVRAKLETNMPQAKPVLRLAETTLKVFTSRWGELAKT